MLTGDELVFSARRGPGTPQIEGHVRDTGLGPITVDGRPVVSAVYFCVRDTAWGTVTPTRLTTALSGSSAPGQYKFSCTYEAESVDLRTVGEIEAFPDGSITFSCQTTAGAPLRCARIGWVVILPLSYVGRTYETTGSAGDAHGVIPDIVAPQLIQDETTFPMIGPFAAIRFSEAGGAPVLDVSDDGTSLELEDQRNWADASFKIYQPPLSLVTECTARRGETLEHQVRLLVHPGEVSDAVRVLAVPDPAPSERPSPEAESLLPAIGLLLRPDQYRDAGPDADAFAELLKSIAPGYLRLDAGVAHPIRPNDFTVRLLRASGLPAELDIHEIGLDSAGLALLADALEDVSILRVHVLGDEESMPSTRLLPDARRLLPDVPILAGPDGWFAGFNRCGALAADWDGASWGVCPQVHDFADATILRSHESVQAVADTARQLAGPDRMLVASPLILKPHKSDQREPQDLGAAWLRMSIECLGQGRIDAVTVAITESTLRTWQKGVPSPFLTTLRQMCASPTRPACGPDAGARSIPIPGRADAQG